MKYLIPLLFISLPAHSQFSFFNHGKKTNSLKVSYECHGKTVKQKVKFKSDGETIKAKADTACPEQFLKELEKKITEAKENCSTEDKGEVCRFPSEKLKAAVELPTLPAITASNETEAQKIFDAKIDEIIADPSKCHELPITQDSSRFNIMVKYPKVFSKGIDKLNEARSDCRGPLLSNYRALLSQLSKENDPEVLAQIDLNIRKLIVAQRGKDGEEWLKTGSCQNTPFKDYEDLGKRIKEYEVEMKCMPLKNNSERIVLNEGGHPIYRLSKDANGNIETALALNVMGPAVDGVTPQEMLERAQKCLNSASKYLAPPEMKGFKVKIMDPIEARAQGVPVHDIGLTTSHTPKNQNIVSYADKYRTDISCGVIAHEVMHLLGLPDEYKHDASSGCFTPPPLPSLMGGMKSADKNGNWGENVPQALECECSSDECKKVFAGTDLDLKNFYSSAQGVKLNNTAKKMKCTEVSVKENWAKTKDKSGLKKIALLSEESHRIQYEIRNLHDDHENFTTTKVDCSCDPLDESCLVEMKKEVFSWKKALARKEVAETCPFGFSKKSLFPSEGEGVPGSIKLGENSFKFYTKTKHTGMLLPAQVALIASGHCPNVSRKYTACYAWGSYSEGDEFTNLPDDVREANASGIGQCKNNSSPGCVRISCSNRPKYCDELSTYLNP